MRLALTLLGALVCACPATSQGGQADAKKIMEKIRQEMEQIDKLLNDAARSPKSLKSLLTSSIEKSVTVEKEIDRLLEQAKARQQKQRNQQRNQQNKQQQQRDRNQQRRPDNRMDRSPDLVDQQKQQQGDPKHNRPEGPQPDPKRGKNTRKGKVRDGATGKNPKTAEEGEWGDLPEYLRMMFKKSGLPSIPSKYKPFRDEFHKRVDRAGKKR